MSRLNPDEIRGGDDPRNADILRAKRRPAERNRDHDLTALALRIHRGYSMQINASVETAGAALAERACNDLFRRLGVSAA